MLLYKELTDEIIAAGIEVHRGTGSGLLESVYEECLCRELCIRNIQFERQVSAPLSYKGIVMDGGFRADLIVAGLVVVELKAVERVLPIHEAQLLTYMKLLNKRVGLLMNFHAPVLKDGITRRVL